jgi:hypothetical protein
VQQGREQPKVGRHRGLEGEEAEDPLLDVEVEPVHLVVAPDHLLAGPQVNVHQRLQRLGQQPPRLRAGLLDFPLKGLQLLMEAPPRLAHPPDLSQ